MASGGNDFVMDVAQLLKLEAKVRKLSSQKEMEETVLPVYKETTEATKKELRARAPKSAKPRPMRKKPSLKSKQEWRDGRHAIDKIEVMPIEIQGDGEITQYVGVDASDTSPAFYLKFHEFGTSKMSPRPFVAPTRQIMKPVFVRKLTEALEKKLEELEE